MHACITSNRSKRPRLTSFLAQCPLQFDVTITWHSPQILGKLSFIILHSPIFFFFFLTSIVHVMSCISSSLPSRGFFALVYPLAFSFFPLVVAFPLPCEPSSFCYPQAPSKDLSFEEIVIWKIPLKINDEYLRTTKNK